MSINEGKLNPGIDYQFEIITYTAACLSENKKVENFWIYTNREIPIFDDIIVKVKYESERKPFVYLGQVKRYKKNNINFNAGKDQLQKYLPKIWEIKDTDSRNPFLKSLLEDVLEENIEFWYISNSFLSNYNNHLSTDPLRNPIVLDDGTHCYLEPDTTYQSIFPLRNGVACYKLITEDHRGLPCNLRKLYFFLKQPDHNHVAASIENLNKDLISIGTANDMINFVNAYLKPKTEKRELTKYIFETHLLRLCLSPFIVSPTEAFEIDPKLAEYWNKLVTKFDVTLASSEMESYIFGYLWQEVIKLYDSHFNWNEIITKSKKITKQIPIGVKFKQLVQDKGIRHWLYIPDTIMDLLIEMWKCDYLPLVLSAYTDVSILDKYKHLGKKFVILHRKEKLYNEISYLGLRVFATAADIHKAELAKEFLESILISMQGREPIGLFSILNDDIDLMKQLKCDQLLYFIRQRKNLLSLDEDFQTGRVKDEDGNDFYVDKDRVVPIIGKCFAKSKMYIDRYLCKPTVTTKIYHSEKKVICFFTGDLNSFGWAMSDYCKFIDESIGDIVSRIEFQIERERSAFIGIKDEYVEELWSQFSLRALPLLHVKVENSSMLLLKYRNCPDIGSYISYNGPKFKEESFFEETSTGVTVITGEPGSGKSTLLRSLFNASSKHSFVLFCDLKDYRQGLCKRDVDLFKDPINFILRKEEAQLTLSNKLYSKHHLNFLRKFLENTKELVLFLDAFDEILPECEGQVLDFIRILNNTNGCVIIASRLVMAYILGHSLEVELLKIDTLSATDIKKCLNNDKIPQIEFKKYPLEFLENPLYLNFLITLHRENVLPSVITPSTLYDAIIEKRIKLFYHENNFTQKQYQYRREEHLEIYKKLALVEIFDGTVTDKLNLDYDELRERCIHTDKLKLGLILRFNDEGPIFLHRTIAEFLVAEWLSENIGKDYGKKMYMMLLKNNRRHIRYLLDDILCRNRSLHKAVIQGDMSLVKRLCSADDKYLKEVDELNRTALDIAAIYSSHSDLFSNVNLLILEEIVHQMILKGIDISERNSITNFHWTDYLKSNAFLECVDFFKLNVARSLQMYFVYQNKVDDGITWSIEKYQLDTTMALLKHNDQFLSKYFNDFLIHVVIASRMDLLYQVIEFQCYYSTELDILCRACKNLLPVTEVSACTNLTIGGSFTAVHVACIYGSADVVRELVRLGVEVNAVDGFQLRPLYYAIEKGSIEIVAILAKLFKKNDNLPSGSPSRVIFPNYLQNSFTNNKVEIAKILLDNGFDIDVRNEDNETALHVTVENKSIKRKYRICWAYGNTYPPIADDDDSNINRIKFLLEHKASCNIQNNRGETPLHIAVGNERLDVTEMLLSHGANPNIKCRDSDATPLHIAASRKNIELVKLLLQYRADVNLTNQGGDTALFSICRGKDAVSLEYKIVETLVNAGVNVNHRNLFGYTALHEAVLLRRKNLVGVLLDFNANVNIETNSGSTALMTATKQNCAKLVTMLLEKGAKTSSRKRSEGRAPRTHTSKEEAPSNF